MAATYALTLVALIAILGLAFDYARMVNMDTELQNAADQAALAAASQLDGSSRSIERAIAAAQGGLVSNSTLISNDGEGRTIDVTNSSQVVFYISRVDAEAGTNSFTDTSRFAEARFVEVTVDMREVDYAFTPIVGLLRAQMSASAVAGIGSALCRIPPLMICNPYEAGTPATETAFNFDDAKGKGVLAKPGGGGQWAPGNYGYIDIGTNGAVGVREALGWDGPGGDCISVDSLDPKSPGEIDTQTGNIASGPQAINTRFDVYSSQGCASNGVCSPALNSRKDLVRPVDLVPATGNSCNIGNNGWREPANAYHPTSTNTPYPGNVSSMGHPRDLCHAVQDGTTGHCKNQTLGNGSWDRDTYFKTHFKNADGTGWTNAQWTTALASATLTTSPSIGQISRYDVYKWEEKASSTRLSDTQWLASGTQMTTRNEPVCGQKYGFTPKTDPLDRRRMTLAVINCKFHNVSGSSSGVPVATWVDVFIVQPSYDRGPGNSFTRKDEIYAEIIGQTDISRAGAPVGPTIRRDVPYLVR
ncbi:pilus assembly protein TadG-related protein [Altererythrobacter litoralis]|uniref:Pilus assembly protein TadG-related protein n=1 Tax=Altererythrobacter litoralis TaxID=3113904 RepID=A0ABU7GE52_9SPHN|nr:pilus assembly protein TadG-related protein [Erythrobacteraceae bacterium 1XM1-14]